MKFHEYLAWRDGISLEEAARRSLARTWELAQTGKVMVLITAFVQGLSHEKNAARNAVLASDIRDAKFGYTPLYGYWAYDEADPETGVTSKMKAREDTFLVSAPERIANGELRSIVLRLDSRSSSKRLRSLSTLTPRSPTCWSPTARRSHSGNGRSTD